MEHVCPNVEKLLVDWDAVLSFVTVLTAIIAILQTHKQIKINNKQHLFDRRISTLTTLKNLICSFENTSIMDGRPVDEKIVIRANIDLIHLVNTSFFDPICSLLSEAVENGICSELVLKRNELRNIACSLPLIYCGNETKLLERFVLQYEELLKRLFLFCAHYSESNQDNFFKDTSLDDIILKPKEEDYLNDLMAAYDGIKEDYLIIKKEKAFEKLAKQTKLL